MSTVIKFFVHCLGLLAYLTSTLLLPLRLSTDGRRTEWPLDVFLISQVHDAFAREERVSFVFGGAMVSVFVSVVTGSCLTEVGSLFRVNDGK